MRTPIFAVVSSLLLLVSLVFLVLATVSVPIAAPFKLATTESFQYGLLGYCQGLLNCTKALYPIRFGDLGDSASFTLSNTTRNMLSRAFIVCPIAAGFTLFTLVCSVISICFDTSALKTIALIFNVICFLASAVSCVMIVLVFVPHVAWLGWLTVGAAGCALLSFPLLFFSVGVHGDDDDESDDENVDQNGFYAQDKLDMEKQNTTFTSTSFNPVARTYGNNLEVGQGSSTFAYGKSDANSKNYPYGGGEQSGYRVKLGSADSLLNSRPNVASDVTKTNSALSKYSGSNPSNFYSPVNINNGPSTSVSANRQMAPNFVASPVVTGSTKAPAPYPQSERGLALYNSAQYGVFDHHPDVEGHQPFTELEDNELPERTSVNDDRVLESDEESHFTSVSQRVPNEMYNNNSNYNNGAYQGNNYAPNNMVKRPNNYNGQQPMGKGPSYNGAPPLQNSGSYNSFQQQPQQPGFQQGFQPHGQQYQQGFQPQGPQFQPGYQAQQFPPQNYQQFPPQGGNGFGVPAPRPTNKPTVSESALNSNPDFSIGPNKRRGGARAPLPPASRMGGGPRPGAFPGSSTGGY